MKQYRNRVASDSVSHCCLLILGWYSEKSRDNPNVISVSWMIMFGASSFCFWTIIVNTAWSDTVILTSEISLFCIAEEKLQDCQINQANPELHSGIHRENPLFLTCSRASNHGSNKNTYCFLMPKIMAFFVVNSYNAFYQSI